MAHRVEARRVYGKGFQHVMASRLDCRILHPTTVCYRHVCTEAEHAHRRCSLPATVGHHSGMPA